jgi:hypothetical protein
VVTVTSRILLKGGVLLLLPLIGLSYGPAKGGVLELGYGVTDNVYQLNIRDAGQTIALSPQLFYAGFLDIDYSGNIALINFETDNLLMTNEMQIAKKILLPGVGNKTSFYAGVSSFYTPGYEQYRTIDITGGNSFHAYFRNYFFSLETEVRYKYYLLDSLNDYLKPQLGLACGIPLPYFFFTPGIGIGFRKYLQELIPFYRARTSIFFPFALDFSAAMDVNYLHASQPQSDYIIPLRYADDPFFEQDNLNELLTLEISATRMFHKQKMFTELNLDLFQKTFYEIEGLQRTDKGIVFHVGLARFVRDDLRLHLGGRSHINTSTIDEFDYMKNEIEVNLELIF